MSAPIHREAAKVLSTDLANGNRFLEETGLHHGLHGVVEGRLVHRGDGGHPAEIALQRRHQGIHVAVAENRGNNLCHLFHRRAVQPVVCLVLGGEKLAQHVLLGVSMSSFARITSTMLWGERMYFSCCAGSTRSIIE